MTEPLVEVAGLQTHFAVRKGLLRRAVGAVRAVDGVGSRLQLAALLARMCRVGGGGGKAQG